MKKKLSLLLAAMLVMTLIPVSSFAGTASGSKADVEVGKKDKKITVKYEMSPGESIVTGDVINFDISNNATLDNVFKVYNKDGVLLNDVATSTLKTGSKSDLVATFADMSADQRTLYFEFQADFEDTNDKEIKEGAYYLNAVQTTGSNFKGIEDYELGTISAATSKTLSIKVDKKDTTVSKDGGALSMFTVENVIEGTEMVIKTDNSTSLTTDTTVRIDRILQEVETVEGDSKVAVLNDGTVVIGKDLVVKDAVIVVNPTVSSSNKANFGSVDATVTQGTKEVSATIGEIVDYNVTLKAVAEGKKEIESVLAGKTAKVEVTIEAVKGTLAANRAIDFEIDGAYLANKNTNDFTVALGNADVANVDTDDGVEFSIIPKSSAVTKVKFIMEVKADYDAKGGVATIVASGRDLGEDLTVDILNVEKAFDIETKVTEIRRGESLATADIEISEIKAGQVASGDYITIGLNGRLAFVDKPVIETSNGMKLDDVTWTVKNDYTAISAKVTTKSKGEPATITISDVAIDLQTTAIHNKIYTASLYVGEKTTNTDAKAEDTKLVSKEYAEFDIVKCVAEYSKMSPKIVFTLGSANYTVDGVVRTLEAPVFTKDNRTMLPIGPLALALGLEVNYNGDTQTATFRDAATGQVVSVKENASVLYNNGIEYKMHTTAVTVNGRIFVPVASITDAFGAKILWDEATQTVTIN